MSDDEFLSRFEACSLERSQWTHESHVRMAWLYLVRFPLTESIQVIRNGIKRLNASFRAAEAANSEKNEQGVPAKPDSYHETITVAFSRLIAARMIDSESFAGFRDRNPDLFDRSLSALHSFYAKERLNSDEARQEFLEPDLQPLRD